MDHSELLTLATDLDTLLALMKEHGTDDRIDWCSLPTFGGPQPENTSGVWSWDETRLLVGTCSADIKITGREYR